MIHKRPPPRIRNLSPTSLRRELSRPTPRVRASAGKLPKGWEFILKKVPVFTDYVVGIRGVYIGAIERAMEATKKGGKIRGLLRQASKDVSLIGSQFGIIGLTHGETTRAVLSCLLLDSIKNLHAIPGNILQRFFETVDDLLIKILEQILSSEPEIKELTYEGFFRSIQQAPFTSGISSGGFFPHYHWKAPSIIVLLRLLWESPELAQKLEADSSIYPYKLFASKKVTRATLTHEVATLISHLVLDDLKPTLERVRPLIVHTTSVHPKPLHSATGKFVLPRDSTLYWAVPNDQDLEDQLSQIFIKQKTRRFVYETLMEIFRARRFYLAKVKLKRRQFLWISGPKEWPFYISLPTFKTLEVSLINFARNQIFGFWLASEKGTLSFLPPISFFLEMSAQGKRESLKIQKGETVWPYNRPSSEEQRRKALAYTSRYLPLAAFTIDEMHQKALQLTQEEGQ